MIKAIKEKVTKKAIELETPLYYKYKTKSEHFTMIGIVTDNSILEITIEEPDDEGTQIYDIVFTKNPKPEYVCPYMWENKITKEEFNNLYYSVMTDISLSHIITEGNT